MSHDEYWKKVGINPGDKGSPCSQSRKSKDRRW